MNKTTTLIFLSSVLSIALILGGTYALIANAVTPQGYLFKGTVLVGIGFTIALMIAIAMSIGQVMLTFQEIMKNQADLFEEVRKAKEEALGKEPIWLGGLFANLSKEKGAISDLFKNMRVVDLGNIGSTSLESMSKKELETELQEAIKRDDFEKAAKINRQIKALENKGDEDQEEENEN